MTRPVAATIGVFDGVHRGHAAILATLRGRARAIRGRAIAVTFDRHPLITLAPAAAPRALMTLAQRSAALRRAGAARVVVLPFTRALAGLPPDTFVRRVLVGRLRITELVVGYDFHFGRGGRGDADLLTALGARLGFRVSVVPPVLDRGEPVSSTRIRRLIGLGRMPEAARLLGRPFALEGVRIHGRRLARRLGFPTINLRPRDGALPPFGVYVVRLAGRPGVANLGVRPTVERGPVGPVLEVHVLGRSVPRIPAGARPAVDLLRFLRPERKFPSLAALRGAIARDVAAARRHPWRLTTAPRRG